MNLSFIFDIINGYLDGLCHDRDNDLISEDEFSHKMQILKQLKFSLANFIKEANEKTTKANQE